MIGIVPSWNIRLVPRDILDPDRVEIEHLCATEAEMEQSLTRPDESPIFETAMNLLLITYPCRTRRHFLFVTWLAIVLAIGVTADLVVDLVFEMPAVEAATAGPPASEEVEDSAEHLLMPTLRDGQTVWPLFVSQILSDPIALSSVGDGPRSSPLGRASPRFPAGLVPSHPQSSSFVLRI